MINKYRILSVIALYTVCILVYFLFFLFRIENPFLFLILTVGSVAILSTSTVYTVIQSKGSWDEKIKKKKILPDSKLIKRKQVDIIEDYIDAIPLIEDYTESSESYKDMPIIDKYIFSVFSQEELDKISLLKLSKLDKILFIREMLYFEASEREILIENMLKSRDKTEELSYTQPMKPIEMEDQIRVYVRSLLEPGEKTKIIILKTTEIIKPIKEKIGRLFDYNLEDFLLSSGGILLNENSQIKDFEIDDDDEIALIPSRKE
ncbi:MAG: hypothetical protein E3J52_10310 [Promethearchaeota archaeon]|nr:MAG: hypothetical protein E3J52_10310 [Candidatus Lokiarchaeota archaeon]